ARGRRAGWSPPPAAPPSPAPRPRAHRRRLSSPPRDPPFAGHRIVSRPTSTGYRFPYRMLLGDINRWPPRPPRRDSVDPPGRPGLAATARRVGARPRPTRSRLAIPLPATTGPAGRRHRPNGHGAAVEPDRQRETA